MIGRPLLASLALLSLSGEAPPAPAPAAHWVLNRNPSWCSLFRVPESRQDPIFEFRDVPAANEHYILFPLPIAQTEKIDGPQLVLQPSGEVVKAWSHSGFIYRGGQRWDAVRVTVDGDNLLPLLRSASRVELKDSRGPVAAVDLPGASGAVAALAGCEDALLAKWGIDVGAYRSLASPPKPIDRRHWFSENDYPMAALFDAKSGYTVARLAVDETGAVADCATVAKSGSDVLDWQTCKRLRASAHYRPARDAQGRAVRAQAILMVEFTFAQK
ncbi:MAG: hypothetical protein QOH81_3172 [Sphingomonadales bacterium]|jgi:hypothetical protein|nr:hypothetical protein [Sphingomonadales bacterium]